MEENSVYSILEYTATDGKVYKTKFYNLDAILSVGYMVNSINATMFRKWANQVLKDYRLRGYSINQHLRLMEQRIDHQNAHDRFLCIDDTVYHIGAALKDLGKKWFAFSRMEVDTNTLLQKM